MVYRDLNDDEIIKLKEKINTCKAEDCIDQILKHIIEKWKSESKTIKKRKINGYDKKQFAHNAVRFDNRVVLQNLNPCYHVNSEGTRDLFKGKKIVKTARGTLSVKISKGYVGKITHFVTFTCGYCLLKGKILLLVECLVYKMPFLKTNSMKVEPKKTHGNHMNQCGILN